MKDITLNENEQLHSWRSNAHQEHWNNEEVDLRDIVLTWVAWQWDNNPSLILNAMKFWIEDKRFALEFLIREQPKEWQDKCWAAAQKLPDFWDIVFYTPLTVPDFETLESSLRWQSRSDWDSLWRSRNSWDSNPSQEIWAYYHLLSGQLTNSRALENLRACWYKDKNRVMSIVKDLA
jgi:hypothetical protein